MFARSCKRGIRQNSIYFYLHLNALHTVPVQPDCIDYGCPDVDNVILCSQPYPLSELMDFACALEKQNSIRFI